MLFFLAGCTRPCLPPPHLEYKPHEDRAIECVWTYYASYSGVSMDSRLPPIVEWVPGDAFHCTMVNAWCNGEFIRQWHVARVAWPQGATFSRTALAHELCHAFFGAGHDFCVDNRPPIETANDLLRAEGL